MKHFKLSFLIIGFMLILANVGWGQTTIVSDGLNNSTTLFTLSNGAYYSGNSGSGDRPVSSPFYSEGSYSRGISNGTATLISSNINTNSYSSISMTFSLASFSINSTGNGADAGDIVTVEVSPDGGINYYSTLQVKGNSNAYWSYTGGTGNATTPYDGNSTAVTFSPTGGGNRTTDGYSTVTVTELPSTTNLKIRITLLNSDANERWVIDDFKITGSSSTTPTITVSPTTLTGFTYVQGSGPSSVQQFSISGSNLTNNISIAAPTNYEISTTSGSGYTTPITLTQTEGTVNNTTIYVRLKSGLSSGNYNEGITATSSGASNKTVTCSGTVTAPPAPSITVNPISLTGFTYITGSGPSAEQTFTISGSNLTNNISIAAPTNYEISTTSGSGYTTPITLTQTGGTVSSTTIFVRLKSGLPQGNYNNESITASSTGASNKTVTCSGTVTAPSTDIWSNPITGTNPNTSNPYTTGDVKNSNITVSGIGRGTGISGTDANDRYNANSWNTASIDLNAYFSFTITPNTGYEIDFVSFVYTGQKSSSGPNNFAIRSSIDGYTSNIGTPTDEGTTIDLSASVYQNVTGAVEFRFYGWGASASGGTFSINDFTFNGNVNSLSTPVINASPNLLNNFVYIFGNGPSVSQSFNLSGSNFSPSSGNITISGTDNYEVSNDNNVFLSSINIPYTNGILSLTPIFVRLKSGLSIGSYNENISISGGNASSINVSCNGNVSGVVYWDGGANTTDWHDAANWSNDAIPSSTDAIILDNTYKSGSYAVDIGNTNVILKKLSIIPSNGNFITLTLTSANTGTPGLQVGDNTNGTDDIIIGNGGILINSSGANTAIPIDFIPSENGTFKIENGGKYIHNTERQHSHLVSSLSTASGTELGIFEFDVSSITGSYSISLSNRTYGSLILTNSTQYNYYASGSNPVNIRGNLIINSSSSGTLNSVITNNMNIKGNFVNNGPDINLTQPIVLNGTSEQNISGTGNITFSNLTLDNNNGVTLNRNITVSNSLTLTNGILNTLTNNISFSSTATSPVETATKYILGNAVMQSRDLGTDVTIDFLGLSLNEGNGSSVNGLTFTRNTGTAKTYGTSQSITCSWDINGTISQNGTRLLTLKWYNTFDNGKVFSSANHGQLWKSVDNGTTWTPQGNLVNVSSMFPRAISTNISSFSSWTASDANSPLPVKLASFNGIAKLRDIKINWNTTEELNNSGFDIERKSENSNWMKVGFVNGKNAPSSYEYTDKNLTTGKYQYRLKQIDYNGNFEYHTLDGIVEVGVPAKYDLSQNYPNPFNPVTKINFDLPKAGQVSLKVFDILGKEVKTLVNEFKDAGYYNITFDASGLPSGVYFYRISAGEFSSVKKLVLLK